ncbi:SLAC1 family transporter, partial [Patulibacter sp. S7RM1-6]
GLAAAAAGPYVLFTRHAAGADRISPTWLLPVVPPMVSAATGAALLPHLPTGAPREALLVACYALFGVGLLASLVTITLVWGRLATAGPGPAVAAPALFVVLGPLGQSVTAAGLLGVAAPQAIGAPYADAFRAMGLLYGVPVWGFALLWLALAVALVLRAARHGLPFSLSWWSFTFPVGTVVTGTSVLADATGLAVLAWLAVALYGLLLAAWATAAARTVHGGLVTGALLRPA